MTTTDADVSMSVGEELQQDQFIKDLNSFMKQRGYAKAIFINTFCSTVIHHTNHYKLQIHLTVLCIIPHVLVIRTPIPPAPSFGGRPFDLCALYKHVTDRGGLENVSITYRSIAE